MPQKIESSSTQPVTQEDQVASSVERPVFDTFVGGELDERGEYKEPTPEEREKFNDRVVRMSEVLEEADFPWYLDGATNISLYGDQMIRNHKDLDMSVFKEDLSAFEGLLSDQGFGIFVNFKDDGRELMRRVSVQELDLLENPDLSICKVGSDEVAGLKDSHESFNFVDLRIRSKDEAGNVAIAYSGISLPREYFRPIKKALPNGKTINLSHPAVVAYHKLHSIRPYDIKDLQILAPLLTPEDFLLLRESVEKEAEVLDQRIRRVLLTVWEELSPVLEASPDLDTIAKQLHSYPEITQRKEDKSVFNYIASISQYLSKNPGISVDDFIDQSISILAIKKQRDEQLALIARLEH